MSKKKQITVYFNEEDAHLYDFIDANRGRLSRSACALKMLEDQMKQLENT